MRRVWMILLVAAILILGGSYVLYALQYEGKYNLSTELTVSVDVDGGVAISGFTYDCDEVTYGDFWAMFKGHSSGDVSDDYTIYYTLNQSGARTTWTQSVTIDYGGSAEVRMTMKNLAPGEGTLVVAVRDTHNAVHLERSFPVVVGP